MSIRLDYREGNTTKAQRKELERLQAWFNNEPFRESNRQKAADMRVPQFTLTEVLEAYIPPAAKTCAQYFTPLDMSLHLYKRMTSHGWSPRGRILDPCAGVGHLLYHLPKDADITAIELDIECAAIGETLFRHARWLQGTAFEYIDLVEGQYDTVIMNPPFGAINRGAANDAAVSQVKPFPSQAQYQFLELAIRALKPGGWAIVIAPHNLLLKMPKGFAEWFFENAMEFADLGQLPGKFKLTSVNVHGYILVRTSEVAAKRAEAVAPATTLPAPPPAASQIEKSQPSTSAARQMSLFD